MESYVEVMNTIQKIEDTPIQIQATSTEQFLEMLKDNIAQIAKEYNKNFSLINELDQIDMNGDICLIFRVLENITRNAFQYAESEVTVRLFQQKEMLYTETIDNGQGFSPEDLKQALTPFYKDRQADFSHFGLGLSICKTLCKNHGGNISISNTMKSGGKVDASFLMKSR